jgi:hypothetical protein
LDSLPVVRRGIWSYDGVDRDVRIVVSPKYDGSGDSEDEPEIRDDRDETTFVVEYQTLCPTEVVFAGGGQFRSLPEAIRSVETLLGGRVRWYDAG